MYNFGSPKVGNKVFHSLYKRHVMDSFRVQVDGDLVTGTPFSDAINKYEHHGSEVLIDGLDASGSIIINPTSIELRLRARPKTSVTAHSTVTYLQGLAAVLDSVRQFSEEESPRDDGEDAMVEAVTGNVLAKYDSVRSTEKAGSLSSLFKFSNKLVTTPKTTGISPLPYPTPLSHPPPASVRSDEFVSPPVEFEIDHPDPAFGVSSLEIDR